MQSTYRTEYNAAVWHEVRSHTFVRNLKQNKTKHTLFNSKASKNCPSSFDLQTITWCPWQMGAPTRRGRLPRWTPDCANGSVTLWGHYEGVILNAHCGTWGRIMKLEKQHKGNLAPSFKREGIKLLPQPPLTPLILGSGGNTQDWQQINKFP